jgi:hypothetical protein
MKNYFVQTLCKICAHSGNPGEDVPIVGDVYPLYKQLQEISYSSFRHFMQGEWEYVLLEKEVDHVFDVFKNNFQSIYDLRQAGPCNILFCGLDAQMVKPTEIFGKYDKFMMFNYTDPKNNSKFINNFNCDVRYYPVEMDQHWWNYSLQESKNLKVWEDEQNIYNDMLWGQGVTLDQVLKPSMAFQAHMMGSPDDNVAYAEQWNNLRVNDSHIVHWHSSRGPENRIWTMSEVNRRTGVSQ